MVVLIFIFPVTNDTDHFFKFDIWMSAFFLSDCVTQSKVLLLTTWQANKSRDDLLGQGIKALFRKPADWEDGGPVSQRTIFPELDFRFLLY